MMGEVATHIAYFLFSGLLTYIFVRIYQKIHNYDVPNKRLARVIVIVFLINYFLPLLGWIACGIYLIIHSASKPERNTGSPNLSAPDELRKWKQLMDEGVITQEEFEQKKRDVLNDRY